VNVSGRGWHAVGAPRPADANDGAQQDADHRHEQVERVTAIWKPRKRFSKPSLRTQPDLERAFGMGTRNQRSKMTKITIGIPSASTAMASQPWRPTSACKSDVERRGDVETGHPVTTTMACRQQHDSTGRSCSG